ncbi:hypothetical protein WEB32_30870 [Streptomyces netropsis]|uniref:Uncharacterized protein n=1 Tax=Streptomyces netropsis TaxID=55404 RepID=A0A7W7L8R4_STRNE|nr:hypothetical protein [Streptomyces netropsis]MBB4885151.1 hypothetical protein [Streptomyces netropsis]GGR27139.1 hypothetical protein GCM10010219_34990 [Streptomyces netropsis]
MSATPDAMTAFTSGLADIDLDGSGAPHSGEKAATVKSAGATGHDMAATLSGKGGQGRRARDGHAVPGRRAALRPRRRGKLGIVPWMSGLPMESYRHQIAVRR